MEETCVPDRLTITRFVPIVANPEEGNMADERDADRQAQAAAQADLELSEKDAEDVKGGGKKKKKGRGGALMHTQGVNPIAGEPPTAE